MVKILGLPFDGYVDRQINIRQSKLAKTTKDPEDLTVFNSNTAWVRLSSGVKIDPSRARELNNKLNIGLDKIQGPALARNLVLWGGTVGFNTGSNGVSLAPLRGGVGYGLDNSYGFLSGPEQGLKPMPGITSITCNYKNNGSLKQAQVSLKCFTRSQFEALEAVYLRLGYTMVLEWGNTLYFDNDGNWQKFESYTIPNILFKDEKEVDPQTITEGLQKAKISTAGNYDGMLAKVANYSWTLGSDLSFDIKLDLISTGDIIDSLKANVGGSSNGNLNNNFTVSGSIQNIVAIQVNRQASRFNEFLYQLYDTVYKDTLTSGDVNEETKKIIKVANDVAKDVQEDIPGKIRAYFKDALAEFKKVAEDWNELVRIAKKPPLRDDYNRNIVSEAFGLTADEVEFWNKRVPYYSVLLEQDPNYVIPDLVQNLKNPQSKANQSVKNYLSSLEAIQRYLDAIKINSPGYKELAYVTGSKAFSNSPANTQTAEELILQALDTGAFDRDGKITVEGSEFDSPSRNAFGTDNIFENLLEALYGGDF
jgi:hypothetical protein